MSKETLDLLRRNGLTIAFAESMTGGAVCAELIKNAGASDVISGSIVAYSKASKIKDLHLEESVIDRYGIVSKEVANDMALSISYIMHADIGIGITGNAGPTYQEGTQKQEVFIACWFKKNHHILHLDLSPYSRSEAIAYTVDETFKLIEKIIIEKR